MPRERVLIYPPDEGAVSHYRLRFPAAALQEQGYDAVISEEGPLVLWIGDPTRHMPGSNAPSDAEVAGLEVVPNTDVVVFQRQCARRWWGDLIIHWKANGIRVVIDVDDRFDKIHPRNAAKWEFQPSPLRPDFDWKHLDRACRLADAVTASTPALAERFGHGHGIVIPNYVPEHYLQIPRAPMERTVGWAGIVDTHPDDLETTEGGVGVAMLEYPDWSWRTVGSGEGVPEALGIKNPVSATGLVPFDGYPLAYSELEVAIVPLADNLFNRSKSALKLAEASSLGIPALVSPTPDNYRLLRIGCGTEADTASQWRRKMKGLMNSRGWREEIGNVSRELMKKQTYTQQAFRHWRAWTGE